MDFSNLNHSQLNTTTQIKSFDCGDADLNDFLFEDAKNYYDSMMAVTYLLEDTTANKTIAYYSLLNDKIIFDPENKTLWNKLNRNVPNSKRRKDYPAVKVGRLAVSKEYVGNHIGTAILLQVMMTFAQKRRSGCRFITVDAYADAIPFYEKCGFHFLSNKDENEATRAMYFDLKFYQPQH
jgi:predicted GNAT family N-acyltransferase